MSHIQELQEAIRDLHGVESEHIASVPVKETFKEETVWDGVVEVFSLSDHPTTDTAYAWLHDKGDGSKPKRVTVLHIPPVISPLTAVRAFIVQEFRGNAQA